MPAASPFSVCPAQKIPFSAIFVISVILSDMKNIDMALVAQKIEQATQAAATPQYASRDALLACLASTDYTTLKETDSPRSVSLFTRHAIELTQRGLPPVASICVYPSLVDAVGVALAEVPADSPAENIAITAVCGAFPSGQTYLEVKMLECAMAIENGADEIDVVINVGAMLSGDYDLAESELAMMREEIGGDALLKVILETGSLADPEIIYRAAMIAMEAGADFIKTSTGKTPISATPAAAVVMCRAIRDFERSCSRKVGIKVAGGIRTPQEALLYRTIVAHELGEEWLNSSLFRIGASRLVDALVPMVE